MAVMVRMLEIRMFYVYQNSFYVFLHVVNKIIQLFYLIISFVAVYSARINLCQNYKSM